MLALVLACCIVAPPKQFNASKIVCTKYKPLKFSNDECFNALWVLVRQDLLKITYAKFEGKPTTVILELSEDLWDDPSEDGSSSDGSIGPKVLGLTLLAYKAFDDVAIVEIFFSELPVMRFFLNGDDICVKHHISEEPCIPEEIPSEPKETPPSGQKYKA